MKKVTVKAHKRTKKGKSSSVRQHTKKYVSAEEKKMTSTKSKKGAGKEIGSKKKGSC